MGIFAVAPRLLHTHQVSFMRASVAYNTVNIGTAGKIPLGTLPAGAIVTAPVLIKITAAFNAATTNVLTVGTAASADAVIAAGDVDETVIATTLAAGAVGYTVTEATPLFITYTQTGTAATTGAATIILEFVPNNDR